jgi:hypothetical protein
MNAFHQSVVDSHFWSNICQHLHILHFYLLDHVKNGFIFVKPNVMIWNGHRLESHAFGIFEKRI